MDQILNEKYLTMVIKQNGDYTIGLLSMLERNIGNATGWYTINVGVDKEMISVIISGDDYRIPKIPTLKEIQNQKHFLSQNESMLNKKATEIANKWDPDCDNYIIGDCAFVFDDQTAFTESKLRELIKK